MTPNDQPPKGFFYFPLRFFESRIVKAVEGWAKILLFILFGVGLWKGNKLIETTNEIHKMMYEAGLSKITLKGEVIDENGNRLDHAICQLKITLPSGDVELENEVKDGTGLYKFTIPQNAKHPTLIIFKDADDRGKEQILEINEQYTKTKY